MWRSAGLFRTRQGLEEAVRRLERAYLAEQARKRQTPPDGESWRHFNLVTVAKLIASAALRREESRGAHFREDFPARDDRSWKYHMVDRRPPE
jgi:L-aspartate oxidase